MSELNAKTAVAYPTERTCGTCGNKGFRSCADCIRGGGARENWYPKGDDVEPRPAAQDADECRDAFDAWIEAHKDDPHLIYPIWQGAIEWYKSLPSRPMSAEVEKAIEAATKLKNSAQTILTEYDKNGPQWTSRESGEEYYSASYVIETTHEIIESCDLIFAALKEKA